MLKTDENIYVRTQLNDLITKQIETKLSFLLDDYKYNKAMEKVIYLMHN